MSRRTWPLFPLLRTPRAGAAPRRSQPGPFDHLKCYRVKDLRPRTAYTVTLTPEPDSPFSVEAGCTVQKARELCIPVAKTVDAGQPFDTPPGAAAQSYLCYTLRCPKEADLSMTLLDQLGGPGVVSVKRRSTKRVVCVPVAPTTTTTNFDHDDHHAGGRVRRQHRQPADRAVRRHGSRNLR